MAWPCSVLLFFVYACIESIYKRTEKKRTSTWIKNADREKKKKENGLVYSMASVIYIYIRERKKRERFFF